MQKIFLDFDNTLVESNKRIIEMINDKYNLNKSEKDLSDYYYSTIYENITPNEIEDMFGSGDFFDNLVFKSNALEIYNKYKNKYEIIITTKGNSDNLEKKERWLREHLDNNIKFLGLNGDSHDKSSVNMNKGIQIDDNANCLRTNASVHILYKDYNDYPWQKGCENKDIIIIDEWNQIDDILKFYDKYDYKTLNKRDRED